MQLSDFINVEKLAKLAVSLPKTVKPIGEVTLKTMCYNTFEEYVNNEHVKPLKGGKVAISDSVV